MKCSNKLIQQERRQEQTNIERKVRNNEKYKDRVTHGHNPLNIDRKHAYLSLAAWPQLSNSLSRLVSIHRDKRGQIFLARTTKFRHFQKKCSILFVYVFDPPPVATATAAAAAAVSKPRTGSRSQAFAIRLLLPARHVTTPPRYYVRITCGDQ